jgi:predicted dehydrogenase
MRVGIVGIRNFGTVQLAAFRSVPGVEVMAVCGADSEHAAKFAAHYNVPRAFGDYRDMLEMDELDLVSVCTPPDTHYPIVMAALETAKDVLCEKPLAMNVEQASEMADAARRAGLVNAVSHEMRYTPRSRRARELINAGYIGEPTLITINAICGYVHQRDDPAHYWGWLAQRARGGGCLFNHGSHILDLLRYLLGEFEVDFARTAIMSPKRAEPDDHYQPGVRIPGSTNIVGSRDADADDTVAVIGHLQNQAPVVLVLTWAAKHGLQVEWTLHGNEGTLVLESDGRLCGARGADAQTREIDIPASYALPKVPSAPAWHAFQAAPFAALVADIREVGGRNTDHLFATFQDGVRVQEDMDRILRSAEL